MEDQKDCFVDFSKKRIITSPLIQMKFPRAEGDCHIKSGYKLEDDFFIVKIATGFYKNRDLNLPVGDGAVLVFSQRTGLLQAILCDGGYLTTLRTAIAACISAQLTPWTFDHIGILGTGRLAKQILDLLKIIYPSVRFSLWGRTPKRTESIAVAYPDVKISNSIGEVVKSGGLIISTTASSVPIIDFDYISKPTHVVALGADEMGKQECDPRLYQIADCIIVDNRDQAILFGDIFHAIDSKFITQENLIELGEIIPKGISEKSNLILTNLSGIAAQDIAMAHFILRAGEFMGAGGQNNEGI